MIRKWIFYSVWVSETDKSAIDLVRERYKTRYRTGFLQQRLESDGGLPFPDPLDPSKSDGDGETKRY